MESMPLRLRNRLHSYSRFVKAEHTLFSVPLIFSGAVLAGGRWPSWQLSGLILAAGFGARTAAFALNRIIDRHIDAKNPRTAVRELPQGVLKLAEAWGIFATGVAIYLVSAAAIAPICLYASPIPLVVFVIYPYLKRLHAACAFGRGCGRCDGAAGRLGSRHEIAASDLAGDLAGAVHIFLGLRLRHHLCDDG